MPVNEALFWVGITMLGTGLYVVWDRHLKSLAWSALLIVLGGIAIVYSVYVHLRPASQLPLPPVWFYLLVLTWCAIGYDIYDRRSVLRIQSTPRAGSRESERKQTPEEISKRSYQTQVFTVQDINADLSSDPKLNYKDKVRLVLTNATGKELNVWTPIWESKEVLAQYPFGSNLYLSGPSGWKVNAWDGDGRQCITLPAGGTFMCWIGLLEPIGEGIRQRLKNANTGTAIFPVKIDGELYEVPIKL
jgi:hypothetical protein